MHFTILYRSVAGRVIQHLAFWGLSYYVLIHVFASSSEIQPTDHLYTAIFLLTVAIGVYANLYLLIPLFLNRKKYLLYAVLLGLCITSGAYLNQVTFEHIIDLFLPGYYFISYFGYIDLLKFFSAFIGITSLVKLSKGYFILLETRNQLMKMQKEKSEAELNALKVQINPHFLFNGLNGIYSLVLNHSDEAPGTILKLSEILRYIIYETRNEMVDLKKELDYMQDYIFIQKLRSGPLAKIDVRISGDPGNRKIAPLLFLPLIENSFKHGIKGETGSTFVIMEWTIGDGFIRFLSENNKGQQDDHEKDRHGGIGLENLKQRLKLTYPEKHHLKITETEDRFKVELTIHTANETDMPDR
jgi:sensor histidine kinase YesM